MMKALFFVMALSGSIAAIAQQTASSPLTLSGYLETYYTYDAAKPGNNTRPAFIYSHNRDQEINVNLAFVKAAYRTEGIRAALAVAAGTYMNANYAAEPGVLKNLYEANAGVKLSRKHDIWLDAGLFASHIGWESAVGKDCWTLSRSLAAENSPYFETGVKAGYTTDNGKWFFSLLLLNGWQRIQRVDGNRTPAFGTQVTYKPNAAITLNSSTFIGNDKADSVKQMRYFHDLYAIIQVTKRLGLIAAFDIGAEQKQAGASAMHTWYTPALIVKYAITPRAAIAARVAYFDDRNAVLIATGTPHGFRTWEYSANFDYALSANALWRVELRNLDSKDRIFTGAGDRPGKSNLAFSTALAISF